MAPFAYIANYGDDTVSVIDTEPWPPKVVDNVLVGIKSQGVAVSPDKKWVYVTQATGVVRIIDTATNHVVQPTLGPFANPLGVVVSSDGTQLYVANSGGNTVSVVNTATYDVTTLVGGTGPPGFSTYFSGPSGVAIGELEGVGTRVYVTNAGSNRLVVVDPAHLDWGPLFPDIRSGLFSGPLGVAVTPDAWIFVTNVEADTVTVVHEGLDIPTAQLPAYSGPPVGVAITPDGTRAYVAVLNGFAPDYLPYILVIDTKTRTVVETLSLPELNGPVGVSVTPDGRYLYVTNYWGNSVTVVSLPDFSQTATVNVGRNPYSFGQFI